MDCGRIQKIISLYLSGALSEKERGRFEAHLASCSACREEVSRYEATYRLLDRVEDITPSEDFQRKLNARIRRAHTEVVRKPRILRRVPAWVRGVAAVAACVAIAVGLWFYLQPPKSELSAQEEQEIVQNLGLLENLDVLEAGENGDLKIYSGKEFEGAKELAESGIDASDISIAEKDSGKNP
jgi:anti-sigma-K factor RskA